MPHIPKDTRYTLGAKIDALLIEVIEGAFAAGFLSSEKKGAHLERASSKLDLAKFFLQVAWEMKVLDNKKYAAISERLQEIGRMLGGWLRQAEKEKTSPVRRG